MAFNPFEAFSIRSKLGRAVMAILGIVVMLTFVLSTGAVGTGNDFFDQIGSMFSSQGRGEVVAEAYGDGVTSRDLDEIRRQRQAAHTYMQNAVDAAYMNWARELEGDLKGTRISAETKRDIERFVSLKVNSNKDPRAYQMYLQDFLRFGPESQRLSQAMQRAKANPNSEDKKALDAVAAILLNDVSPTPVFLLGLGDSEQDVLNFYLLLKKADQLGINYSEDEVVRMIKQDTLDRLTPSDFAAIERQIYERGRGDVSSSWLIGAIGNEYRARMALSALQGESPAETIARERRNNSFPALILGVDPAALPMPGVLATQSALPGALTPHEYFEFYKDRCSEHSFAVLELNAEDFIPKVTGEPTAKELNDLFNKHRGELPDPSKDRPGFKDPRKVKVEFVTLDATNERIAKAIPKVEAASQFLCASAGVLSGDMVSALTYASQPAIAANMPIKQAVSAKMEENKRPYDLFDQWTFRPRDYSVYRPQPIVALLGGFAGFPASGAVAPMALAYQQILQHELAVRAPMFLQSWLTPFNPTMANVLGMPAFAYALTPKLPPEGLYLKEAAETVKKQQRQGLFLADVNELRQKLFKIAMDSGRFTAQVPDKKKLETAKTESQKVLTEWLKERNLTPQGTEKAVDQFEIVQNPSLKPLNDMAAREPDGSNSLSNRLFATDPRTGAPRDDVQPFDPFWFPGEPSGDGVDKPNHFVWVSEEIEAKTYNTLTNADAQTNGEMTKRVTRAWKLEKARALAKAEAERLADKVRGIAKTVTTNPEGVERQIKDLAAENKARAFELERLALLKFKHEATTARMGYEEPKIEKDQVLYPPANFVEQLLALRKQSLGGVTVVADEPRTRYYVACETERFEKTVEQFKDVFTKSAVPGPTQNPLYERHALPEERGRAIQEVFDRLRADANLELKDAFKERERRNAE